MIIIKKIREMWKSIKNNMPSWVQAIATVVLVCTTITYVKYSGKQVDVQKVLLKKKDVEIGIHKQQFVLVNRAKIYPKLGEQIVGGIDGGKLVLENTGNLPAEDFRLIWKIVKIVGDKVVKTYPKPRSENNILSLDGIEELNKEKVSPEDIIVMAYKSEFDTHESVVLMVAAWRYKGRGIEGYMVKDLSYLWNTFVENPYWAVTSRLGYDNVRADTSMRAKLRQFLGKEN